MKGQRSADNFLYFSRGYSDGLNSGFPGCLPLGHFAGRATEV